MSEKKFFEDYCTTAQKRVVFDALIERRRQDDKWGEQNHDPFVWIAILGEGFGEASQAALEYRFGKGDKHQLRDELVRVAAVALAFIECIDRRNKWSWGSTPKRTK